MDKQTLLANIEDWFVRDDLSSVNSILAVVQPMIDEDIRVRAMIQRQDIGVLNNRISIPSRFLYLIDIRSADEEIGQTRTTWRQQPIIADQAYRRYPRAFSSRGSFQYYSILGESLHVAPALPDGTLVTLTYFERVRPLINDTDTNWILDNAYDVYHFACLSVAADYIGDSTRSANWLEQYKEARDTLNLADQRSRRTGNIAITHTDRAVV